MAENIALACTGKFDLPALRHAHHASSAERYGLPVDPHRLVHDLSVGERQRVEILRCLLQNPRLLILDEPTSVLTPQAVRRLFETLRQLAAEGCSILYISHKLDEIRELCDARHDPARRQGHRHGQAGAGDATDLARLMIGADIAPVHASRASRGGSPCGWQVRGLSAAAGGSLRHRTARRAPGRAQRRDLGIAGVSGNGQEELLAALSASSTCAGPAVLVCGVADRHAWSAGARRDLGMRFVPEERLGRGAVPAHDPRPRTPC